MGRLACLVCLLLCGAARAQVPAPAPAVRATVAAAYEAYHRRDLLEAQRLLFQAYQRTRDERLFYALGRTWEEMGHSLLAMYAYERFLQRAREAARPGSSKAEDAKSATVRLASRLGRLLPRGPAGAWYQIDGGRRHRVADGPLWVWPGDHVVQSAAGELLLTCPAGERETMKVGVLPSAQDGSAQAGTRPPVELLMDNEDDDEDDDDDYIDRSSRRARRKRQRAPLVFNAPEGPAGQEPPPPPLVFEQQVLPGGAHLLDAFEAEPPPRALSAAVAVKDGPRGRWPRLVLSVAPIFRARSLVIEGDPAVPAQGCYTLDAVLPEDPGRGAPRGFTYKTLPACPSLSAPTGGLGVDAVYYPFARYPFSKAGRWWAGLGLHGALNLLAPTPENGVGFESELGLRWVLGDLLREGDRLGLLLDWRVVHAPRFAAARLYPTDTRGQVVQEGVVGADAAGLPSATYHSLGLGLGFSLPYARVRGAPLSFGLEGRYLGLLAAGEIATLVKDDPTFAGGYGPVTRGQGHGGLLRITPIEVQLRPDLALSVQLSYEGYRVRFRVADPAFGDPLPPEIRGDIDGARFLAPGAREDRFGIQIVLHQALGR